ncbi:hypothetical protein NQ318_011123 [Aromia moschata]|uniref:Protein Wnt n=1 Tax=Aromia moschata TaxID=1265417 RepID=A0AAV8YS29_9CUCU|nr:hypothetical protein NQ318_011123 [Aromia moschata]
MGNSLSPFIANLLMSKFETEVKDKFEYFPRVWFSKTEGKVSQLSRQQSIQSSYFTSYMDTTVCRTVPGLTKSQIELCYQQPDSTSVALEGLNEAVKECQYQFQGHRWNCSSLATKGGNPYINAILQRASSSLTTSPGTGYTQPSPRLSRRDGRPLHRRCHAGDVRGSLQSDAGCLSAGS